MAENRETIKLESLSVGARIAFIRKIRGMTQKELGNAIGIEGSIARNAICRYERTSRVPRQSTLQAIADVLDTDVELIKKYDFKDPLDLYYIMLWVEEICPNFVFNKVESAKTRNNTQKVLVERYTEWHRARLEYQNGMITRKAYIEWKLLRREKHESCVREALSQRSYCGISDSFYQTTAQNVKRRVGTEDWIERQIRKKNYECL